MPYLLLFLLTFCFPMLADATTRYADSTAGACTGNYSIANRNCTGADGNSYATVAAGLAATAAGDTLKIRTGTYLEHMQSRIPAGSVGAPTIVTAYCATTCTAQSQYEVVTIRPASGRVVYISGRSYITVRGLVLDGVNGSATSDDVIKIDLTNQNITLEDNEIENGAGNGILANGNNYIFRRNSIHNNGRASLSSPQLHGIYLAGGTAATIESNDVYSNGCYGLHIYPNATNATIRYNLVHANATKGLPSNEVILSNDGHLFERNLVYGSLNASGAGVQIQYTTPSNTTVRHNIIYNNGLYGVYVVVGATGILIQNNIILAHTTNISDNTAGGAGSTETTNKTTGTITDCTVSTSDFTHKAGSSCIDAGTNISLAFDGSAPDQGAFEMPVFSTCVVENGDASTLRVTFSVNLFPPLLPSSSVTGFTARKATVNDVITASTRTGDTRYDFTLTNAIVAGNAVDVSYTPGTLTDSAKIGNSLNQTYRTTLTNQSCTNNVGAAAAHVFTQAAFEFHGLRGTEAAPVGTPYATAPENTNIQVRVGGSVRLRLALTCTTADCPPTGFYPYYSKNAGAYAVVPDTFGADNVAFCGVGPDPDIPSSGTPTTDQLSTGGTFVAGALVRTSNAIPTVDIALNGKTELEYCFSFDTDATATDTYDVRIYRQDTTAIDAYTVTPRITLASPAAGMGF